jgi:hypothetical protein
MVSLNLLIKVHISVFDAAYTDAKGRNVGKFFNNPAILRHSMLYR